MIQPPTGRDAETRFLLTMFMWLLFILVMGTAAISFLRWGTLIPHL